MFNSILATLAMIFPAFLATGDDGTSPFFGEINHEATVPAGDYVFINSPGGLVDKSFEMVPELENKTCIVFNAASAALMIILPACKERYYVQNARLGFHSAVYFLMFWELTQWGAEYAAKELAEANRRVLIHMVQHGAPFTPDVIQYHMQQNTVFDAETIHVWEPWIKPVEQCYHCPDWVKMVQLKPTKRSVPDATDGVRDDASGDETSDAPEENQETDSASEETGRETAR